MAVTNKSAMIKDITQKQLRSDLPVFEVGDTIKMKYRVQEGEKTRLHPFQGTVIGKTGRGARATFTLRKISFGEGVERTFPIHSPLIEAMEVVSKGVIKRAKLYYLRGRVGKQTRVKKAI